MKLTHWSLIVLTCLFGLCFAVQDVYVTGDFLMALLDDDNDLSHVAAIAGYNIENDEFEDIFNGGVYTDAGSISVIQNTPLGTYVAGFFRFVGTDIAYSNCVALYDDDDNANYKPVNGGIWIKNGQSVRYIAGIQDKYVAFAGTFDQVEYLSLQSYVNGDGSLITVPNIVLLNGDNQWIKLSDPNNVFPSTNSIGGLASNANGTLYIYTLLPSDTEILYSWSETNHFQEVSSTFRIEPNTMVCDAAGNVAGVRREALGNGPTDNGLAYYLEYLDASTKGVTTAIIVSDQTDLSVPATPKLLAYAGSILVVTPDPTNFNRTAFLTFSKTSNLLIASNIPDLTFSSVATIVVGQGLELWAISSGATNVVYYYTPTNQRWIQISLVPLGVTNFNAYTMTYDAEENKVFAVGTDSGGGIQQVFLSFDRSSVPPTPQRKYPGPLMIDGSISSTTVIRDEDDDDFELFVGGVFTHVGNGLPSSNLASWKDGEWKSHVSAPVSALASHNGTVYYSLAQCAQSDNLLGLYSFHSDNGENFQTFSSIPLVTGSAGCVSALYADEDYLYVGGNFTVVLPGSQTSAHALIAYSWASNVWIEFGIPFTIGSTEHDGYVINSLAFSELTTAAGETIECLAVGGLFDYTYNNVDYHSFALLNTNTKQWLNINQVQTNTIITELIPGNSNEFFLSGLFPGNSGNNQGVELYNYTSNSYVSVGNLQYEAQSILLYTENGDETTVFAGGNFLNGTNTRYGLTYYDLDDQLSGKSTQWVKAGKNLFNPFYDGTISNMIYESGGVGQDGENGYYEDPSSSSSGMTTVGKVFLSLFIIAVFFVIVGAVIAGLFFAYKRRSSYQEIGGGD